jgi:hypothetical protein
MSGRHPRGTGIILNDEGVPDPYAPLIGSRDTGASPYKFRGSALIDWMRNRDSSTRALSVSRKDRGAILPLGRAKQAVYWYAPDLGFTTSSYYADTLPTWVRAFNQRNPIAGFAGYVWSPLLEAAPTRSPTACRSRTAGAPSPSRTCCRRSPAARSATSWPRRR